MQMNALQRTPGMLMNTLTAHCNALQCTTGMLMNALPAHCNALQHTPDMLINALPVHSSALHICKWVHFQRTPNAFPMHFFLI